MPNILIIAFSNLKRDPRVRRQAAFLMDRYEVTIIGRTDPQMEGLNFIPLKSGGPMTFLGKGLLAALLKARQFEKAYWSMPLVSESKQVLKPRRFDLILANDLDTLPLAVSMAEEWGAKVIFDAHEYAPRQHDDQWLFRFFIQSYRHYLCSQYLSKVDAMITVSQGIAEEYSRVYGVPCQVLTNAPFYENQEPIMVDSQHIRLVHHGALRSTRQLENMIYLMDLLDERFSLDMMLIVNDGRYFHRLKRLVLRHPRVHFRDPVPMLEISRVLNEYDIGIYLLPTFSFNARLASPNKLFEFIQGRLCVAIWPSPEMARVVREYDCGVVANDFTLPAMAAELNRLTGEEISHFKQRAHEAASILCAEKNRQVLLNLVDNLIG